MKIKIRAKTFTQIWRKAKNYSQFFTAAFYYDYSISFLPECENLIFIHIRPESFQFLQSTILKFCTTCHIAQSNPTGDIPSWLRVFPFTSMWTTKTIRECWPLHSRALKRLTMRGFAMYRLAQTKRWKTCTD